MKFFFAIALFCLQLSASAQLPILKWAKPFHANNTAASRDYSNGRCIATDKDGNVYTSGFFSHTVDFDPGPAVFNLTGADGSAEQRGTYISKLDSNGHFIWAKQIPVYESFGRLDMKVDSDGTIYLVSDFNGTVDMDPGPSVLSLTSSGLQDAYVMKLTANGDLLWVKQFGGSAGISTTGNVLDFDQDGNVFVTGLFSNTVDFDPGPGVFQLTSTANTNSYLVKLTSNGDLIWVKQFGQAGTAFGGTIVNDLVCDTNGAVYMAGNFSGVCDFDLSDNAFTFSSKGLNDGFVLRIDTDGNFNWAKHIVQTGSESNGALTIEGIAIDGMHNVVATGSYIGTYDFDPGAASFNRTSVGGSDFFVLKLNEQGRFSWANVLPGNEGEAGTAVVVDAADAIYTAGSFGSVIDLDPGPAVFLVNNPFNGAPTIVKLTTDGHFEYGISFPGLVNSSCLFRRMAIDAARNIHATGFVGGVVDFDPGPSTFPVSGTADLSPFVLKLGQCTGSTTSTLNITTCNAYNLNGEVFDSSGTYLRTMPNAKGCDSIITLNLTLTIKRSNRTVNICSGESFFVAGNMQTQSGIYNDTLQTAQGCDSIVTTDLVVNRLPQPQLGADRDLCSNETLTLSPGVFTNYSWQNNATTDKISVTAAGKYWVEVTNQFNCKASDTLVVKSILPAPVNFLNERDSICSYDRLEIMPFSTFENYNWSTGDAGQKLQVVQPGLYWLTVTDKLGCKGTDSITVYAKQCKPGVYFPTAFTPNADGLNDIYKPMLYGVLKQYRFAVYNRWGKELFHTNDPAKGWDGRVAGVQQQNVVFVWSCTYQLEGGALKTERGTMLLIQ